MQEGDILTAKEIAYIRDLEERVNRPDIWFDKEYVASLTKEMAIAEISNRVYDACHLFERLEGIQKVVGNGHHMMQAIAGEAEKLLVERWVEQCLVCKHPMVRHDDGTYVCHHTHVLIDR